MKILSVKVLHDLRHITVSSELRSEVLERYESYLDHLDELDEIAVEIKRDMESTCPLSLNAYAAQSFVQDIEETLISKKGSMYKAVKRFYRDAGIYIEFDRDAEHLVFSGESGRATKAQPDFVIDGKGYVFNEWLKLEDLG